MQHLLFFCCFHQRKQPQRSGSQLRGAGEQAEGVRVRPAGVRAEQQAQVLDGPGRSGTGVRRVH